MDFELKTMTRQRIAAEKCDALVVLVPQDMAAGDDALSVLADSATAAGDFERKPGKLLQAYQSAGIAAKRVILAGVAEASPKSIRNAVTAAVGVLKGGNSQRVLICMSTLSEVTAAQVQAAVAACNDCLYVYGTTKSKPTPQKLQKAVIAVAETAAAAKAGFDRAVGVAKGVDFAREWGNRPANYATPVLLAGAARELGKLPGVKVEILGPKEVEKLGMGSFMAVAKGSEEPLRFIILRYEHGDKTAQPVVLVGKGITFDTGGISIKPSAEMDEMKFDMCGAASVLGTFRALAHLKPAINVIGLIPACENMPDGRAIKPGDVVTSMSGQTIEILNTDAEGRLVLCDALTYAERFKPRAVIDIATLTGACVVALGGVRSGLFSSDEALAAALSQAGETSMDLCWRLPLDDEYADGLKTNFADVANVAGRAGGAVTAAKFLQRFTGKFPWAHLDIAGTAWKGSSAKGSTGRPVPLLVEYLLSPTGAASAPRKVSSVGAARKAPAKPGKA
ncbi:MAG: leucyl aminopeptidase [Pseudomonadota bacterium]